MATNTNNLNDINETIIGIDLGTTVSCVAVWKNGKVDIIANNQGQRTTPSCVTFTPNEISIGEVAKQDSIKYPQNAIYGFKRLMGKRFMDQDLEKDKARWPFRVVNDIGRCKIRIEVLGQEPKEYFPEEISSFILMHLKEIAENYLGQKVTKAVVTVPAYFNDAQRQATKDAGTIAGLKVVRVLNEPTAAAIAYGWENKKMQHKILVYDFGGGTFDVSILEINNGNYNVIGTDGDIHLGGLDIDNNLCDYFLEEFKTKFKKDISTDISAIKRLSFQCEKVKQKLSQQSEVSLELDSILKEDFTTNITRARFEDINSELFLKTINIVKRCLEKVKLLPKDIDDLVVVGGSTRIPKVEELIKEFFSGKDVSKAVNPDEAVAIGAAIQAAILGGEKDDTFQMIKIYDVTSLALGTTIKGGLMSVVIEQNTKIPTEAIKSYYTVRDKQRSMNFPIYQGNRPMANDNFELGEFSIANLTLAPPSQVKVDATFKIDTNGILSVKATEVSTGASRGIEIDVKKIGLNDAEIEERILQAQKYQEEDRKRKELINAKNELEAYCVKLKSVIVYSRSDLPGKTKTTIKEKSDEVIQWMDEMKEGNIEDIRKKKEEMMTICEPLLKT